MSSAGRRGYSRWPSGDSSQIVQIARYGATAVQSSAPTGWWCGVMELIVLSHCGDLSVCREAGAASIIFASASPMIKYPNVYGIDMPSVSELIAHGRTEAQVAEQIGADAVVYNDLSDLEDAVRECAPEITTVPTNRIFDTSCFNGSYVTGDVDQAYFDAIEAER